MMKPLFVSIGLILAISLAPPGMGQPIRIGELNSYAAQPSFLEPYRKGWALAFSLLRILSKGF